MKKVVTLIGLVGMFSMVACGPSAEDIAAAEKAKQDSIAAVEAVQTAAQVTNEQVRLDSIATADKAAEDIKIAEEAKAEEAKHQNKKK